MSRELGKPPLRFELVGGQPVAIVVPDPDGTHPEPDGVKVLSIQQAAERTGMDEDTLKQLFDAAWGRFGRRHLMFFKDVDGAPAPIMAPDSPSTPAMTIDQAAAHFKIAEDVLARLHHAIWGNANAASEEAPALDPLRGLRCMISLHRDLLAVGRPLATVSPHDEIYPAVEGIQRELGKLELEVWAQVGIFLSEHPQIRVSVEGGERPTKG